MNRTGRTLRIGLRTAFAALLAVGVVTGCANIPRTASVPGVTYTCCAEDAGARTWHPGQQLRIAWISQGRPARGAATTTLTAVLTGPYRTVAALKAASQGGTDLTHVVAAAPQIVASGSNASSPVSVVTIPADAAPGYYNLRFGAAAAGIASYGATIISVG